MADTKNGPVTTATSIAELEAKLAEAQAKIAALSAPAKSYTDWTDPAGTGITLRITNSALVRGVNKDGTAKQDTSDGSFAIYGVGRFPITLTDTQVLMLAKAMPGIVAFVAASHDNALVVKGREARAAAKAKRQSSR